MIRLAYVGEGGVGKSAITMRYIYEQFVEGYDPSESSSSYPLHFHWDVAAIEESYRKQTFIDGNSYLLDILDTAGPEECCSRDGHFRSGKGFAVVFSLVDHKSFEELNKLHAHLTS